MCGYLDGRGDALLVAAQAFALLPAHRLQHLVPDVVAVQPVFSGLLVVPAAEKTDSHHQSCSLRVFAVNQTTEFK